MFLITATRTTICPCGSAKAFSQCCFPYINNDSQPPTPEALMRSRYSAYATKNSLYIYDTYAIEKKADNSLKEIEAWASETRWVSLEIINSTPEAHTELATVSFTAKYVTRNKLHSLTECSRFRKDGDRWYYVDGDITEHKELAETNRNSKCPCSSGKKFKQCCGK